MECHTPGTGPSRSAVDTGREKGGWPGKGAQLSGLGLGDSQGQLL